MQARYLSPIPSVCWAEATAPIVTIMHQDNIDNNDYNKLSFNQLNISPWNDTGMLLGKLTSNISELLKNQENNTKRPCVTVKWGKVWQVFENETWFIQLPSIIVKYGNFCQKVVKFKNYHFQKLSKMDQTVFQRTNFSQRCSSFSVRWVRFVLNNTKKVRKTC